MATKKKPSASQIVYESIREQILHLKLTPGVAISEIETAAKYNISRTPVRDVFKALEAEGLLEIKPHIGTFVSLIDLDMISDILYMREVMEQALFKDLATIYDKSQEYRIQLVLQEQKSILESDMTKEEKSRAFIISDNRFHHTLYELAGKKNVALFFNTINSQYERFRTFINMSGKSDLERLYNDHVEITEYIANNDLERLKDKISHHIYDGFNENALELHKYSEFFNSTPNK
ncbi:MAG: GntR family transcriptional regulator [Lachnospiraceae bacterium]|nr:GntR family transcriptional regulator [Lachnospiraceae bacterium]